MSRNDAHLFEPDAPQHGKTIFSRCGEAFRVEDAEPQYRQPVTCAECRRLMAEDDETLAVGLRGTR